LTDSDEIRQHASRRPDSSGKQNLRSLRIQAAATVILKNMAAATILNIEKSLYLFNELTTFEEISYNAVSPPSEDREPIKVENF